LWSASMRARCSSMPYGFYGCLLLQLKPVT
jgi:hypothetical protein